MVTNCNDIIQCLQDKNPYLYPPEILALEGQRKIFQLHFAPESTKERRVFFLDTTWDDTPLLIEGTGTTTEAIAQSSKSMNTSKEKPKPMDACEPSVTKKEVVLPRPEPVATKGKETDGITDSAATVDTLTAATDPAGQQMMAVTPPEQIATLPDPSKGKYGPRKTSVRKPLFSEEENAAGQSSLKKTKKNN